MRFVETKTLEQQSCLMLHSVINAIRVHLAEFGIVAPVGRLASESFWGRRRRQ
jgi:transposase